VCGCTCCHACRIFSQAGRSKPTYRGWRSVGSGRLTPSHCSYSCPAFRAGGPPPELNCRQGGSTSNLTRASRRAARLTRARLAVGVKDAGFPISVGGQVVEVLLTLEMLQTWHGNSLYHLPGGADIKGDVCATGGRVFVGSQMPERVLTILFGLLLSLVALKTHPTGGCAFSVT
jgi:hypothetical protein